MSALRRVPWIVWALLAPLVIMGVYRLVVGGGRRVPIVGSGRIAELVEAGKPAADEAKALLRELSPRW